MAPQTFLNAKLAEGKSIRNVHIMREVLSPALTSAVREELIGRNVARLTELPGEGIPGHPALVCRRGH